MIARLLLPLAVATIGFASAGKAQDPPYKEPDFPVPPEAVAQAGVPAGQIHRFVMDERGAHSGRYGGSILPDSLRWLWR